MDRLILRVGSFAGLLTFLVVLGCGSHATNKEVSRSYQNLKCISIAYFQATDDLKHPPNNLDEFLPYLKKQGDPATLLRSPDDDQDYKILWGVDVNAAQEHGGTPPVLAYEQEGKGGKRYVLQVRNIVRMTDEELKKGAVSSGIFGPMIFLALC